MTATSTVHEQPTVTEPHSRMIVFTWDLGELTDARGRSGTAIAELVVQHRPDTKAFTAFLRAGLHVPHAGTGYHYPPDGTGWAISQPITRYSRPRLTAFAAHALAALRAADPAQLGYAFEDHQ